MWRDADDYASVLSPFVEEGLAAGEAIMVAVVRRHANWLRESLGAQARTADPYAASGSRSGLVGAPRKFWSASLMRPCSILRSIPRFRFG
jgi:hypothetical protein